MPTVEITTDNFDEVVKDNDLVLLDFWASWCGPCQWFAPVFEEASDAHPDLTFGKVNTEVEREISAAFNVMSIPTLAVLRDNIVVFSQPGALPAEALEQVIEAARGLDMDDVRSQVAAQKAEAATG